MTAETNEQAMPALPVEHSSTVIPGSQVAALLRFQEHVVVDAILEAPRGRVPLEFHVDLGLNIRRHLVQTHQRRAPDGVENVFQNSVCKNPKLVSEYPFLAP